MEVFLQRMIRVNKQIRAREVLLIDKDGNNLGKISFQDALQQAYQNGLDLVEVSNKDVPVCRIIDYSKWKFEQAKRQKKKKVGKVETKEIQFRPNIGANDLQHRAKNVDKFLSKGNRVKLVVRFKGREKAHMLETGRDVLDKFLKMVTVPYVVDNTNEDGHSIFMILKVQS